MFEYSLAVQVAVDAVFRHAAKLSFPPRPSVRCPDSPAFRTQLARDLACLLDIDDEVVAWSTLSFGAVVEGEVHVADFAVTYEDGSHELLDAVEDEGARAITEAFACLHKRHRFVSRNTIDAGCRLQNARDLLAYAWRRTPLNDRVRLLAALDEAGSLQISETFGLFRETQPMTAISYLLLHRFITADLDEAPIGPQTVIRRFHK